MYLKHTYIPWLKVGKIHGISVISKILIRLDHKPVMFLQLVELRSLGGLRNKIWLQILQIMLKLLRFMKHIENVCGHDIQESSGIVNEKKPTKIFEDNLACVAQLMEGFIKSARTKHIPLRFFSYIRELKKNKKVDVEYVRSCDNPVDLFTKALPTIIFRKHVYRIGMRHFA